MKRKIITINDELCDGCGNCVSACSEGALHIVNGKAKLVKEDFCDGFGDCIRDCPTGALKIEERESNPFDAEATREYLFQAKGKEAVLRMEEAQKKHEAKEQKQLPCGCPGSMAQTIQITKLEGTSLQGNIQSELRNWPIQIRLLPVKAEFYREANLLIAAHCCAYAYGRFHQDFIEGHTLAIGCPKLDDADAHRNKLATIMRENDIRAVRVAYMEVPCCAGLVKLVKAAVQDSGKDIPLKKTKISIRGGCANDRPKSNDNER